MLILILIALFIRPWFFSNIYYDFLIINSFSLKLTIQLFCPSTWVNMTKKRMDDGLRVCFPVTPKSSESCTHSSWLHFVSYKTLTCLLNKSITSFVMKIKVPSCVINVMLSTTTKLDMLFCVMQQKLFTWKWLCVLYFTVIKTSIDLSFSSRNKQHCTSCWNSNVQHIC